MNSLQLAIFAGNSLVPGEFPAQRPVARSFNIFFDLRLNKRLSQQSWGWRFETLLHPLWHHCNVLYILSLRLQTPYYTTVLGHQQMWYYLFTELNNSHSKFSSLSMFCLLFFARRHLRSPSPFSSMAKQGISQWKKTLPMLLLSHAETLLSHGYKTNPDLPTSRSTLDVKFVRFFVPNFP